MRYFGSIIKNNSYKQMPVISKIVVVWWIHIQYNMHTVVKHSNYNRIHPMHQTEAQRHFEIIDRVVTNCRLLDNEIDRLCKLNESKSGTHMTLCQKDDAIVTLADAVFNDFTTIGGDPKMLKTFSTLLDDWYDDSTLDLVRSCSDFLDRCE